MDLVYFQGAGECQLLLAVKMTLIAVVILSKGRLAGSPLEPL